MLPFCQVSPYTMLYDVIGWLLPEILVLCGIYYLRQMSETPFCKNQQGWGDIRYCLTFNELPG